MDGQKELCYKQRPAMPLVQSEVGGHQPKAFHGALGPGLLTSLVTTCQLMGSEREVYLWAAPLTGLHAPAVRPSLSSLGRPVMGLG